MTAARVAGRVVTGGVLVLISLAAMLWTRFGPQGAWTLAWIAVVFVVVSCAGLAWFALYPGGDEDRG